VVIDETDICRDIANLHDHVFEVGIIRNQTLVARYKKVNDPPANEERVKLMFAQPDVLLSICKTNEDYFGTLHYLIICFENSDFIFFPYAVDGESRICYVRPK
jgi:hypothetical protein